MKLTASMLQKKPVRVDQDAELRPTNFETQEYQMYRDAVFAVLKKMPGLTTREIHARLGYEYQRFTADVLEDVEVEASWTIPTKYSLRTSFVQDIRYMKHFRPEDISEKRRRRTKPEYE